MNVYSKHMVRRIKIAATHMQNLSFTEFQKVLPACLDDNFSYSYLDYFFRREVGCSINDYFIKKKIEKAAELFYIYHLNPIEVAYQLGYYNPKELISQLKKNHNYQASLVRI